MSEQKANIGVVGMAVMGSNLARNLAHHGYTVAIYNRTFAKTQQVLADHGDEGNFIGSETVEGFVQSIEHPRSIILMVKAGAATDATIAELLPHLEQGDIIMDGGNSFFRDTIRREKEIADKGFHFVGTGISGGEYGALTGPSIMPGGTPESYQILGPMLEAISAHVGDEPCCAWMGPNGAGHFVKMIHNGIEYGMMQAFAEGFDILKTKNSENLPEDQRFDLNVGDIAEVWRRGSVVSSWLLDLTADALAVDAPLDGYSGAVADSGEGRWTIEAAMEQSTPVPVLSNALFARYSSRQQSLYGDKLLSAMRFGFGGHVETPKK